MLTSDVPPAHQHTDPDQVLRDWELFLGDAELEVRVLYRERAHLVAALSAHPGVQSVVRTGDPDATLPTCSTVVYFDTAEGTTVLAHRGRGPGPGGPRARGRPGRPSSPVGRPHHGREVPATPDAQPAARRAASALTDCTTEAPIMPSMIGA
ncbi:MAG: hypothetical protein ACRDZY_15680, partial [Acidimicrobiales bacterium]